MGRRTGTSWVKGQSGNPKGKPKGAKDKVPRGSVKQAFEEFINVRGGQRAMVDAISAGMRDKRRALGFLELAAKVFREVGPGSEAESRPITIVFESPLRPERLK